MRRWMLAAVTVALTAAGIAGCGSRYAIPISASPTMFGGVSSPRQAQLNRLQPADMSFPTRNVGFMSTVGGVIERTGDGGLSWRVVDSGEPLSNLDFVTPRVGFATSSRGRVVRTVDGGRSWSGIGTLGSAPAVYGATGLQFVNPHHGWFWNRDRVFATTDGGRSWSRVRLPNWCGGVASWVGGIAFVSRAAGYLLCGSEPGTGNQAKTLYTTGDGGHRWQVVARAIWLTTSGSIRSAGRLPLYGYVNGLIARPGGGVMMMLDRLGVIASHDGGRHWSTALFTDDYPSVWAVSWPAPSRAYILTEPGAVLRNRGGLRDWPQIYPSGPGAPSSGVAVFITARDGVGAGVAQKSAPAGEITATSDGGRTWEPVGAIPGASEVQQLVPAGRGELWATVIAKLGSPEQLWRSDDGGRSWVRAPIPPGIHFISISFPTGRIGFVMADSGAIYRTRDGGRRWVRVHGRGTDQRGAQFVTPTTGYAPTTALALTGPGRLVETTDAGRHWHTVRLPDHVGLVTVASAPGGRHIWLAGNYCPPGATCSGVILRTADGGLSWRLIRLPTVIGKTSLSFVNANDGYADPTSRGIYRTTDAGRTWRFVTCPLY